MLGQFILAFALAATALAPAQQAPLPEAEASIEYQSVSDALTALRAKPGVVFTTENGWLIATDEGAYSIWSFAPQAYAAYPAVVKRWVIPKQVGSEIRMDVLCEASKSACDDLVRTFAKMNGLPLPH
ncbi:hypothetical protein LZ016_00165 [Sphingomonas sp. SM33]|uniref:Uncharacterized protein n=1 Tax=Sphingomonas telluris TaxID=2907998 RepID=A0ABS9VJ71_9SPHN|nr:hypothetical protein [Sphingomonas telluris]MCH8614524.1 hypothetical protein [Sphingomonas telluris]